MFEFENLSFNRVNWNCQFSGKFETGRFYALCGESGAGKSTLFSLLTGLLRPDSGSISINGNSIAHLPPHQRGIGLMTQHNSLFPAVTCSQNLQLAYREVVSDSQNWIRELADLLNLKHELLDRYPHELSGGQLARMNLARALVARHKWILLDEPFASVDRPNRLSVLNKLHGWQKTNPCTIVLIAHDLDDIFPVATDIVTFDKGKITEQAPLSIALSQPQRTSTARLLKNGLIIEKSSESFFLPSQHISVPSHGKVDADKILDEFTLSNFAQYRRGNINRVFDFDSQSDFSFASDRPFYGTISFDSNYLSKCLD
jgi:ABC-type Fe3+/spermidine/putrescine transport system ATPase subunit